MPTKKSQNQKAAVKKSFANILWEYGAAGACVCAHKSIL